MIAQGPALLKLKNLTASPNIVSSLPGRVGKKNHTRSVFLIVLSLASFCFLNAAGDPFSFFEKAKQHYKQEIVAAGAEKTENPAIDSLLKSYSSTTDFNIAFDLSWKIGLFLLEQGKHAAAMDIYNDLRHQLESKTSRTFEEQKKFSSVLNIIGAIYEETGLWNEALELYMNSLQVCNAIGYDAGKAKVYNNIGKLYYSRNDLARAETLFSQAVAINKKLDIRAELFNNYNNIGGIYLKRNDPKKALEYTLMAMNQLNTDRDFFDLAIAYSNIGNLYQNMGNYPVALTYYQQAASLQEKKSFQSSLIRSYLSIASLNEVMNDNIKAAEYLDRSLKLAYASSNPSQEMIVLLEAARFYKKTGNPRLASDLYDSYVHLNDSLAALNGLAKIQQIQAVYDVINKEKDNKILQQKINLQQLAIQRQRIAILAVILIFLLLAFLLFNLQRNRKLERKRNRLIACQAETLHQNEKEILLQKEDTLKRELDYKNRQLTSHTLNLARNNECIAKISSELKQLLLELSPRDKERSERIKKMLSDLQQHSAGYDWEEFRLYFQEVHQSFEKNLTEAFPDLSPNDKKICALLRLGLTTKDISSITFRELRSVESARNRLRKKLGLSTEVNIQNFISQF